MSQDWSRYAKALPSIAAAVGTTPLVRLGRITAGVEPAIYVKVEWYGATGSLKDRIYLHMFEQAERRGALRAGMSVLECSTGNAGIACAWVAAVKGYPVHHRHAPGHERRAEEDHARLRRVARLHAGRRERRGPGPRAPRGDPGRRPRSGTGCPGNSTTPTTWRRTSSPPDPRSGSRPAAPSAPSSTRRAAAAPSPGSAATSASATRRVKLYAVEPAECALLARREWGHHGIEGIGDGFVPRNLDVSLLTGVITTTTEESVETARRLAAEEGIFCGISSGCNVAAALKLARRHPDLGSIVTMINDTGQRYFTTPLCGEAKAVEIPERDHPMDAYTASQLDRFQSGWEILT